MTGADPVMSMTQFDVSVMPIEHFRLRIDELLNKTPSLNISNSLESEMAVSLISQLRDMKAQIEDHRKKVTEAPNAFVRNVNSYVKELADKLVNIEASLNNKLVVYKASLLDKVRQECALANEFSISSHPTVIQPNTTIRTDLATSFHKMDYTFALKEISLVPLEYLQLNEKSVKSAIKRGIRRIPGVEILEHPKVIVRRNPRKEKLNGE